MRDLVDRSMLRNLAAATAGVGGFAMIGMMLWVQFVDIPPVLREFTEADALIGPHSASRRS